MNVRQLAVQFDIANLREEVARLLTICPFHEIDNQISLTHRSGHADSFYDGVGSLYCSERRAFIHMEKDFHIFHESLRTWYLHEVYRKVWEFIGAEPGRTRLMRLGPKACLSMHRDSGYRFHIAVFTNPQSYMIFEKDGAVHIPADGHLYWTNTIVSHSAMNGNPLQERIHLVFSADSEKGPGT